MLQKIITYTDYNGTERTEVFYFNLTKSELVTMDYSSEGGLEESLRRIIDAKDKVAIMREFRNIIAKSYGIKSEDGRRFIKSAEISEAFFQTDAFDKLFMELITDEKAASDFINAILPKVDGTNTNTIQGNAIALPNA